MKRNTKKNHNTKVADEKIYTQREKNKIRIAVCVYYYAVGHHGGRKTGFPLNGIYVHNILADCHRDRRPKDH